MKYINRMRLRGIFCILLACSLLACSQQPAVILDYSNNYFGPEAERAISSYDKQREVERQYTATNIAQNFEAIDSDVANQSLGNSLAYQSYQASVISSADIPSHMAIDGVYSSNEQYYDFNNYVIKPGDTIYSIAKKHNTDVKKLALINDIPDPTKIKIGKIIKIPAKIFATSEAIANNRAYSQEKQQATPRAIAQSIPQTGHKIGQQQQKIALVRKPSAMAGRNATNIAGSSVKPYTKPVATLRAKDSAKITAVNTSRNMAKKHNPNAKPIFMWPVKVAEGAVIAKYGVQEDGARNDGINIKASAGQEIVASESGDVVYAGDELRGYGNLLIIRHNFGYLTAYAHLSKYAVKMGDFVQKGQKIGYVGSTGNVKKSQLHFALRKGKQVKNPETYLP